MPTPMSPCTGGISESASSALRPAVPCRWSATKKLPTATSFTPARTRGLTGRLGMRLSALALLEKPAALVPLSRVPLVR